MIGRRMRLVVGIKFMVVIEETGKTISISFKAPPLHSKDIRPVRPPALATPLSSLTRKGRDHSHTVHLCHLYLHAIPWTPMIVQITTRGWIPMRMAQNWNSAASPKFHSPHGLDWQILEVAGYLHSLLSSSYLA
jgi:hypothetical protein